MGKRREGLGFADVVSVVALLLALGLGTAWAATSLVKNEVKSKHIAKGGVKAQDLANNAVTSPKVRDGSLLGEDFAAGQLPAGEPGPPGPPGSAGQDATNLFAYVADPNAATPASVGYGEGVTGVSDPAGANSSINPYVVSFDRNLQGCVAQATVGKGDPSIGVTSTLGATQVTIVGSNVNVFSFDQNNNAQDVAFMISILC
jgi:hypothetical protein